MSCSSTVPMEETVLSYAKNAAGSGLDGVVCSPLEAAKVKERLRRRTSSPSPPASALPTAPPGTRSAS